ncbi:LPD29 domain-containing protein [Celeribacter sp.]|uniref:LPD29 domain-containing protein n=1 Tax=Celeribacter sp. TaxID=1890673 RepID=UPI003A92CEB3
MTKRHPIYTAAARDWTKRPSQSVYISTTDTAKLIRATLKDKFPRTKFSVKSSKYAGGASISVSWEDGPTAALVEAHVEAFAGSGFDGMCDMKYAVGAWLSPEGRATFRQTAGTQGNGVVEAASAETETDGAIPVRFSADSVHCSRATSLEHMRRSLRSYAAKWPGCPLSDAILEGRVGVQESRWGGWEFTGNPGMIRDAVGDGSQYGGDIALTSHAGRRMTAA